MPRIQFFFIKHYIIQLICINQPPVPFRKNNKISIFFSCHSIVFGRNYFVGVSIEYNIQTFGNFYASNQNISHLRHLLLSCLIILALSGYTNPVYIPISIFIYLLYGPFVQSVLLQIKYIDRAKQNSRRVASPSKTIVKMPGITMRIANKYLMKIPPYLFSRKTSTNRRTHFRLSSSDRRSL